MRSSNRLRLRRWTAMLLAAILTLAVAIPAFASPAQSPVELIKLLQDFDIVRGDDHGNLNLDKPISRAEMTTIIVRTMGKDSEAGFYKGWGLFADSKDHWADGYLSFAKIERLLKGDGNNYVRPNDPINYAEALTLLLRFAGKEPTSGDWPANVIVEAKTLGIMPDSIATIQDAKQPAIRGVVFTSMAQALTTLKDENGKTLLQKYLAPNPPTNLVVKAPSLVKESTATITGSVTGASRVLVNGKEAKLQGSDFSAQVDLKQGTNTFTVRALDRAGNELTKDVTIVRAGTITRLDVTGPTSVATGATVEIKATAYDDTGLAMPGAAEATVEGNIGTYDRATGKFTASNTKGTGAIVFTIGTTTKRHPITVGGYATDATGLFIEVASGSVMTVGEPTIVRVKVVDKDGNVLTNDTDRPITLSTSGITNLEIAPAKTMKTDKGIATFSLVSWGMGSLTLTAAADGLPSYERDITVATSIRVVLSTNPKTLQANGSNMATVRAELQDSTGATITNRTGSDIVVVVTPSTYNLGSLNGDTFVIRTGTSSSENTLTFTSATATGTVEFEGEVTSTHNYSVVPARLALSGTGGSITGARVEILQPTQNYSPKEEQRMFLRVVDANGNTIQGGSYGFYIKATTTNNEKLVNGLPEGVNITLGDTGLRPVDHTTGVVGATTDGVAIIKFSYNKSGEVTLTPVMVAATPDARDHYGYQKSTQSNSLPVKSTKVTVQGQPKSLGLTASYSNSSLGINYTDATDAPAPKNARVTLTAQLLDEFDGKIGTDLWRYTVQLYKKGATDELVTSANMTYGKATFTVSTGSTAGSSEYYVKVTGQNAPADSNLVTVRTLEGVLPPPGITTRGWNATAGRVGLSDTVGPDDTHLQFLVSGNVPADQFGVVKVYRSGGELIYTSPVMSLSQSTIMVDVPKDKIRNNEQYKVRWNNGAGDSGYSALTGKITVEAPVSISISSVYYDAPNKTLRVNTSSTSGATLDATFLVFTAPDGTSYSPSRGSATGASQFVINLSNDTTIDSNLGNTAVFSGDVRITANEGWLVTNSGGRAKAVTNGVTVRPMAHIRGIYLAGTSTNKYFVLDTVGVTGGNWDKNAITIDGQAITSNGITSDSSAPGRYRITGLTDTQVAAKSIDFGDGWYKVSHSGSTYSGTKAMDVPVQSEVTLRGASYSKTSKVLTLTGTGFLKAKDDTAVTATLITLVDEAQDNTEVPLTLPKKVTVVNDSTIRIELSDTDAQDIVTKKLGGGMVFLTADAGWFVDAAGFSAPEVTGHQCSVGITQ